MGVDSGGQGAVPPWIFIHGTDIVGRGLIVLFFGLFSVATSLPRRGLMAPFSIFPTLFRSFLQFFRSFCAIFWSFFPLPPRVFPKYANISENDAKTLNNANIARYENFAKV